MTKWFLFATAAALLLTTTALADCLQVGRIDRWRTFDDRSVIARDLTHHDYKVVLNGICPNLKFNLAIALKANANSGLDCVRPGDSIVVKAFNTSVVCPIKSVEPYAPAPNKGGRG